jgi:CDP-glucose 4,6-dehydratase
VDAFWKGRRVFVTGHTGFKGGWLCSWLLSRGSEVTGYALPPADGPGFCRLSGLEGRMASVLGDVRDAGALAGAVAAARPEVLFHLAAQPLVRRGYAEPALTFETNVVGTVNVLEAARRTEGLRAAVVVTTDKCYATPTGPRRHREEDPLGGRDPYSASKAATEMVAAAYRSSFLSPAGVGLATARGGNVIGGGDWGEDRIVPDAVRAFADGRPLRVRNAAAVRPWQHVLDLVGGYLELARRVHDDPAGYSEAWNFGPEPQDDVPVRALADLLCSAWPGARWDSDGGDGPAEAKHLALDSSKAAARLGWRPRMALPDAVRVTLEWYRCALSGVGPEGLFGLTLRQIDAWEGMVS